MSASATTCIHVSLQPLDRAFPSDHFFPTPRLIQFRRALGLSLQERQFVLGNVWAFEDVPTRLSYGTTNPRKPLWEPQVDARHSCHWGQLSGTADFFNMTDMSFPMRSVGVASQAPI